MTDLKILTSHPVQYQVPFFRKIMANDISIEVGYYHQGTAGQVGHDTEFGIDIEWDIDLINGYHHRIFRQNPVNFLLTDQIKIAPKVVGWVLRERQVPLLLFGWGFHLMWFVWLLRVLFRAPVMIISETNLLSFAATHKPCWRVFLLRWLLQRTSACFYIGTRNREFYNSMGVPDKRLFHTPYSVENAYFAAEAKRLMLRRQELCQQYGLDPVLPTFVFCGKLITKKRPLQLLEAYLDADLQEHAQLLFIGEGSLRPELEERIQAVGAKNVHLIGFLNQTEMPLAYVLGQLLCLISEPTETWGLVVNEALACGCPVIVTETVGCAPDLVGQENGWIVPLDNREQLTQALRDAYEFRNKWPDMESVGQLKVANHTFAVMAAGVGEALSGIE